MPLIVAPALSVDDSTLQKVANVLSIKNLGVGTAQIAALAVTTAKLAAANVTRAKIEALGHQLSSSSGNFSTTSTSLVDVTNLNASITTTGRPVFATLISDGSTGGGSESYLGCTDSTSNMADAIFALLRASTDLGHLTVVHGNTAASSTLTGKVPPGSFIFLDAPAAGTYTYKVQAKSDFATAWVAYCKLLVFEL